jgi:glycosyltransferase involved in cell wall biosynthesis
VSDDQLVELYANAIGVIFTPQREDLGMVTLEAFESGKPVITCADSGEPARLVKHETNGFICPPDPASIAARIDQLAQNPDLAAQLGARGRRSVAPITWDKVAFALVGALGFSSLAADVERTA